MADLSENIDGIEEAISLTEAELLLRKNRIDELVQANNALKSRFKDLSRVLRGTQPCLLSMFKICQSLNEETYNVCQMGNTAATDFSLFPLRDAISSQHTVLPNAEVEREPKRRRISEAKLIPITQTEPDFVEPELTSPDTSVSCVSSIEDHGRLTTIVEETTLRELYVSLERLSTEAISEIVRKSSSIVHENCDSLTSRSRAAAMKELGLIPSPTKEPSPKKPVRTRRAVKPPSYAEPSLNRKMRR